MTVSSHSSHRLLGGGRAAEPFECAHRANQRGAEISVMKPSRSTKGASKARRDQINGEIRKLRDLLPISEADKGHLSYLHTMSLVTIYLRRAACTQRTQRKVEASDASVWKEALDFTPALPGFLVALSRDGKLVYISENIHAFLGLSVVDAVSQGDSFYHLIDREDVGIVQEFLQSLPETDSGDLSFTCRMGCSRSVRVRSGGNVPVLVRGRQMWMIPPDADAVPGDPLFVALCVPLAWRSQAPEDSNCPLAFRSQHTADMKLSTISSRVVYFLGYEAKELVGQSWYMLVHPEDVVQTSTWHCCLLDKADVEMVARLQAKDLSWTWVYTRARLDRTALTIDCTHVAIGESEAMFLLQRILGRGLSSAPSSHLGHLDPPPRKTQHSAQTLDSPWGAGGPDSPGDQPQDTPLAGVLEWGQKVTSPSVEPICECPRVSTSPHQGGNEKGNQQLTELPCAPLYTPYYTVYTPPNTPPDTDPNIHPSAPLNTATYTLDSAAPYTTVNKPLNTHSYTPPSTPPDTTHITALHTTSNTYSSTFLYTPLDTTPNTLPYTILDTTPNIHPYTPLDTIADTLPYIPLDTIAVTHPYTSLDTTLNTHPYIPLDTIPDTHPYTPLDTASNTIPNAHPYTLLPILPTELLGPLLAPSVCGAESPLPAHVLASYSNLYPAPGSQAQGEAQTYGEVQAWSVLSPSLEAWPGEYTECELSEIRALAQYLSTLAESDIQPALPAEHPLPEKHTKADLWNSDTKSTTAKTCAETAPFTQGSISELSNSSCQGRTWGCPTPSTLAQWELEPFPLGCLEPGRLDGPGEPESLLFMEPTAYCPGGVCSLSLPTAMELEQESESEELPLDLMALGVPMCEEPSPCNSCKHELHQLTDILSKHLQQDEGVKML